MKDDNGEKNYVHCQEIRWSIVFIKELIMKSEGNGQ